MQNGLSPSGYAIGAAEFDYVNGSQVLAWKNPDGTVTELIWNGTLSTDGQFVQTSPMATFTYSEKAELVKWMHGGRTFTAPGYVDPVPSATVSDNRPMELIARPDNTTTVQLLGLSGEIAEIYDIYVVQPGDTLLAIQARTQVPMSILLGANEDITNPDQIRIGQQIVVPRAVLDNGWSLAPSGTSTDPNKYYIAEHNQSIDRLIFFTGESRDSIQAANPGMNLDSLQVGQTINLPSQIDYFSGVVSTGGGSSSTPVNDAVYAPNSDGSILVANPNYLFGANSNWLGNVNTATGNQALWNYAISDGYRIGNNNLGNPLNIGGLGLRLPGVGGGTGLRSYWMTGSSTNLWTENLTNIFPVDPLILDLNGDGVKLTSYADAPVLFDVDNDGGSLEQTGWVSAQDGIVVQDLNGDGIINGIQETLSEYFNGVAGQDGNAGTRRYADGFAALRSLDANQDGIFNSADAAWSSVRVWIDANHDGLSWVDANGNGIKDTGEASELKTFSELGVTRINLDSARQSGEVQEGNEVLSRGSFVRNGATFEAIAARFIANPVGSTAIQSALGVTVTTEGSANNVKSFVSTNQDASISETLSTATLNVKHVTGGAGNDVLTGDAQDNWLAGNLGADSLLGGAGDDVLLVDAADIVVDGGDGLDIVQIVGSEGVTLDLARSNIEMAVGGVGDDRLYGNGRSSVAIRGGAGNDLIVGSAANDVLSGEDGDDRIEGGAGTDLIRGHRGQDYLSGGLGDDVLDGGLDDDMLYGGAGNDVLAGGGGDDSLDGGDGTDLAQYSGSYADYRITKLNDSTWRVVDTRSGRDGADTLTNIEKLSFSDISNVDLTLGSPLPVKDLLTVNSSGQALSRTAAHLISKAQLLGNDRDWDSAAGQLSIIEVLDAQGGTVSLTAAGDVLFTPDASYTGVMSFKYRIQDENGLYTQVTNTATGEAEAMKAAVYLQTPDLPADPLVAEQWYLTDIDVLPVWQDYTGKGVRIGQFEPGGPYATTPEVFDYRHPDLQPNVDRAWLNTLDAQGANHAPQTFSNHATMVAGVMVAARNGEGGVGVAYGATLAGHYIQGEGLALTQLSAEITQALAQFRNYDVVNNSWGASSNFLINVAPAGTVQSGILDAVGYGRDQLGTVVVMAGGNDRQGGANTNYNALTANRAVITTGSINAQGDLGTLLLGQKPFSNPGASILVSAPGSNIDSTSRELTTDNGSTFGTDYAVSEGTSFAAPIVSGVVALMLEANPNLGYRDVQAILAMTATQVQDPNGTDWTTNGATNWNGGGMHVSHDYGYGKVDARAAVRLAETWQGQNVLWNEQTQSQASGTLNAAISDAGTVLSRTLAMTAGLTVESAQVTVNLTHANWGDLIIKLISPSGTESILVNRPGKAPGSAAADRGDAISGTMNYSFNTTHLRGEDSGGTWTLQVIDAATGQTGTLKDWKLDLYGSLPDANDLYVYTNEFASAAGTARGTLADTDGGTDTLNASAVTGNSVINLNSGTASTVAGRALQISGLIEKAFGGDGNDTITGNAQNNVLSGGRGNDTLSGGAGSDRLEGGRGNNTLSGGAGNDLFIIRRNPGGTDTITDFSMTSGIEKIVLVGFDAIPDFAGLTLTQSGSHVRVALGEGQTLVLNNTTVAAVSEQNFAFVSVPHLLEEYVARWQNPAIVTGTTGADELLTPEGADLSIFGLAGDDYISSISPNDLIDGGNGNDTILGDEYGYTPYPGSDWIEGGAGDDVLDGGEGDDMVVGGSGNDALSGGGGDDYLIGGSGDDYLGGFAGNDILTLEGDIGTLTPDQYQMYGTREGGTGADLFKVLKHGGGVAGRVVSGSEISASNLIADFEVNVLGEQIDLTALTWLSTFSELTFEDWQAGGVPVVTVSAVKGADSLYLTLYGVSAAQLQARHFVFAGGVPGGMIGTAGADTLVGNAGANTLDGRGGADTMTGRTGDDTYIVDNAGDKAIELPGGGYDTVQSAVTYTLPENVEALVLTGTANINATGNAERNRLRGNSGNNRLDGGAEADDMAGGKGNDVYVVDDQLDTVTELAGEGTDTVQSSVSWTLGDHLENLTLTGSGHVNGTGNAMANTLTGNAGDNVLDGGQGADRMAGGAGNDTYYVDSTSDVVTEAADMGIDTVYTSVNLTLAANVENGMLVGRAVTLTGNALDNTLVGNALANTLNGGAGNDLLDGGAGADTMVGGAGDDTYIVDHASDVVTEAADAGIDSVYTSVNLTLAANVENGTLTGTASTLTGNALDNVLMGNALANTLNGGAGNDTLDGGQGADAMNGGAGNDVYYVDHAGDTIVEAAGGGTDTVHSALAINLATLGGGQVENAVLSGTAAVNLTGNTLANRLEGNAANNVLNGGAGADIMIGGAGNDTYYVDNVADVVTELSGGGTDTVFSYLSAYTLGANVERGRILASGAANLTGNAAANLIYAGAGNNRIDGAGGNDTVNYQYAASAVTVSLAVTTAQATGGSGSDTLVSIEHLTGSAYADTLTGNAGANTIQGGAGNDTISGGAGNDSLRGGLGNDRLNGGTGNDTYLFARGDGQDMIVENDATAGNLDVAKFENIQREQLWFRHVDDDLEISIIGTSNKVLVDGWYSGAAQRVEEIRAGSALLVDTRVQNLVDAMAAFSPPASGQTTLPAAYQTALAPVIAANWQ